MRLIGDAVDRGVAHVHVGRGHVDLRAQDIASLGELARAHIAEQLQAFLGRAVAPGAVLARLGERAAIFLHLLGRQLVHVGQAALDEHFGVLVDLLVIVGRIIHAALPFEAHPADILLNALDVFVILFCGVGIVEAEVAQAAVAFGGHEIDVEGLGVADVQIAVGFRREAGMHLAAVFARREVFIDKVPDKVCTRFFRFLHGNAS